MAIFEYIQFALEENPREDSNVAQIRRNKVSRKERGFGALNEIGETRMSNYSSEYYQANKDRFKRNAAKWAEKNKEKMVEYRKTYYQQNKDKLSAQMKAYREADPQLNRQRQEDWRRANEGHTYETPDGYVKYIGYEHPASTMSGITGYHRIVLWDKLNGQDALCHWCGKELSWSAPPRSSNALVTDHLNTVRNDNRPENLVPSCHKCNVSRPGGQNRKHVEYVNVGECSASFCDRDAKAGGQSGMPLCGGHWQQRNAGKELTPLQVYKKLLSNEEGRTCTKCETFKPWDNFYQRSNGKHQQSCKACMAANTKANNAKKRAAQ